MADKKDEGFSPGPASSYPTRQTNGHVTVAAVPYDTNDLARSAFGKHNPYNYGVLPVLVVVQNDTDKTISLDRLLVQYELPDGRHVDATPPDDVTYIGANHRAKQVPIDAQIPHIPIGSGPKKQKGPLTGWEIQGRAFAARMLPAHESASGFFYFQSERLPGANLFLTGFREADTGKDLFYFEVPLDAK
jgi:hypothetical protein